MVPEQASPYTVALEARLSHHRFGSGTRPGKCELSQSVEPGGAPSLSLARSTLVLYKCTLVPALCREGLFLVYCIRGHSEEEVRGTFWRGTTIAIDSRLRIGRAIAKTEEDVAFELMAQLKER